MKLHDRRNFSYKANELAKIADELIGTGNFQLISYYACEIHCILQRNAMVTIKIIVSDGLKKNENFSSKIIDKKKTFEYTNVDIHLK